MSVKSKIYAVLFPSRRSRIVAPAKYEFGSALPAPPHIKHETILDYAKSANIGTLIETGTYLGDTIAAALPYFRKIYSIEVNMDLATKARTRFAQQRNVSIIDGDSGEQLDVLLANLKEPAVFWLDGHYSGGITGKGAKNTPIINELNAILTHPIKEHVILIDDARCFIGEYDYPTLFEIYEMVKAVDKNYQVNVKDDIIRIVYAV